MEQRRKFSAGSAPAPDEHDQYLENRGFYRKHTARDSTSLFRVISEQVFDIQQYHEKVRLDCVAYMRKHRKYYEKNFKRQRFDDYLKEMEDVHTYGSKLELEAMGHMYKRNIILFEPFNKGKWFLRNEKYNNTSCLNVFYLCEGNHRRSPDHFDSVFKRDYVEKAAMCQSLIYEILYTKVYKLPDIMLAVEMMLHDPNSLHFISMPPKRDGDRIVEKAITDDGREFVLDTADKTNCVLDDDSLCHFHNKHNFTEIVRYEAGSFGSYEPKYDYYERQRPRYSSMLPDFNKSCVRQLLEQNITPFPFKVAKTLDPFMYRNIEFDVWNDARRSQRTRNWYYTMDLRVGSKCLAVVDGNNYHGYIQEMTPQDGPCSVFVEELGEKITVPYEALKTLPVEELKPWISAYHGKNGYFYGGGSDYYQKYRHRRRYPFVKSFESIMMDDEKPSNRLLYPQMSTITYKASSTTSSEMALKQYTTTRHFQPPPYEQYAMPLVFGDNVKNAKPLLDGSAKGTSADKGDRGGKNASGGGGNSNNHHDATAEQKDKPQQQMSVQHQQPPPPVVEMPTFPTTMMYNGGGPSFLYPAYGYPTAPTCDQPFYYEPPSMVNGTCYFPNQPTAQSPLMNAMPGFYTVPPPTQNIQPPYGYAVSGPGVPTVATSPAFVAQPMVPARVAGKEVVNYSAAPSVATNGTDLPLHDLPTLRYFYNLGIEYHRNYQGRGSEIQPNEIEPPSQANEVAQLNADVQSLKIKVEDTTQTTVSDTLTSSTGNSTSPLVKSESFGGFPQPRENGGHNGNGNNYRGNYGHGRRGNGYNRGGNRRGGYENRPQHYKNNNNNRNNNYNNNANNGGNHNNNNNHQNEKNGGGRGAVDATVNLLSNTNSSNSLSPNTQSSSDASSDFSQVPYQPLYMQPFYSSGPYFAAPEAPGEQQYFQYVQPAQPPHYSAVAPGMAPTAVYVPQSEMIMSPMDSCALNSGGEPVLANGPTGPTFGYMNYPPIIYGPPTTAAPPPFMQPARPANNGYVWCPTPAGQPSQQQQQQQQQQQHQQTAAVNGFNSSGNISQ